MSKEDDAESITVAGKAVIICAIDGEWSERTTDTECIARLEGNDGNGAYYVVGDLDRCVACDTKAICGAAAASYELKKSIKLKSDVTFANCGMDTRGITVKQELCIDLNGRTIAQEKGENAYNAYAAVNVNIENGTLTIRDSSEDKSGGIIGNTIAISVNDGCCVLEGGSIASRGEYGNSAGLLFAGTPVNLTEEQVGFRMMGGSIEISGGELFRVPEENLCTADPTDGFYSYMFDGGSVSISGGYFDFEPDAKYIAPNMKAVEAVRPGYKFAVTDGSPDPWKDQQTVQEENSFNRVKCIRVMAGGETRQVERAAVPQWKPEPLDGSLVLLVPKTGDRPLLYRLFSLLRIK